MYFVYALKSILYNFIYVGLTKDLYDRFIRHNKGYVKSTKKYAPFVLFYSEKCQSSKHAREREKYLKSTSGKRFLKSILSKQINDNGLSNKQNSK
jgi:putative endonuclease